jgi:DNA-binding response OmpR family regulator
MTKKILMVDDDAIMFNYFKLVVERLVPDTDIDIVTSVTGARTYLENTTPDLIILDQAMPGEPGLILLDYLAAREATIPVFMSTARPIGNEFYKKIRELNYKGNGEYLQRPNLPQEIADMVNSLLGYT